MNKILNEKFQGSIGYLLKILRKIKTQTHKIKFDHCDNENNINSIVISNILSYLFIILETESFLEKNAVTFKMIAKLFLNTFSYYCTFIDEWFRIGLVNDFHGEFYIQYTKKNELPTLETKIDWEKDFEMRKIVNICRIFRIK